MGTSRIAGSAKARRAPRLVAVSPSPVAGVDDVVAIEPGEQSAPTVTDVNDDFDRD
jgi:hypothetical protein